MCKKLSHWGLSDSLGYFLVLNNQLQNAKASVLRPDFAKTAYYSQAGSNREFNLGGGHKQSELNKHLEQNEWCEVAVHAISALSMVQKV